MINNDNIVKTYFQNIYNKKLDWWDTISDAEKQDIETEIEQLDNEYGIEYEKVKQKADKLLGRKF